MEGVYFVVNSIQKDVDKPLDAVVNTIVLLEGGATIPFIARYRKEKTGGLDETVIRTISDRLEYYRELEGRKAAIIKSIESQGKLTESLKKKILNCTERTVLEDLYLPYKQKIKTRASIAREKGLAPLADIMLNDISGKTKKELAEPFINKEKGVKKYEDAVNGAKDIIAERISDSAAIRGWVRAYTKDTGVLKSAPRNEFKDVKTKYFAYYDGSELIKTAPSHRLLAIRRGSKEEILSWKIAVDELHIVDRIQAMFIRDPKLVFKTDLEDAASDSYSRLISMSVQVEVFTEFIQKAEMEAIGVFSKNLRNLLLAPPVGTRITLGIDPGFRTGCKIAVIDDKGDFKEFQTIYPTPPENDQVGSEAVLLDLIQEYEPELIAIGNGTASRETEAFVKWLMNKHKLNITSVMVSEAGASVYSASETAVKEFPELDVTARGAISIARRLQDPLAELVKIDPKAIGVGQYQHDVNQRELKRSLDLTVESCVSYVGVDLNTASVELLSYVSGIGRSVAESIVQFRSDNGRFGGRTELKKVPKLGAKVFEQCAGFLKIRDAKNPLDNSTIHPESYMIVEQMAKDAGLSVPELTGNIKAIDAIQIEKYVTPEKGLMTIQDIIAELKKPGRDPRQKFVGVEFSSEIREIEDLEPGMVLKGTVTNVANFGAFVDIGVHQDGLIHISKIADSFVKNPYEVLSVGDVVSVEVLEIDPELKRISLKRISGGKAPDGKLTGGMTASRTRMINKDEGFKIGSYMDNLAQDDTF
jgi:uncharacterized protein